MFVTLSKNRYQKIYKYFILHTTIFIYFWESFVVRVLRVIKKRRKGERIVTEPCSTAAVSLWEATRCLRAVVTALAGLHFTSRHFGRTFRGRHRTTKFGLRFVASKWEFLKVKSNSSATPLIKITWLIGLALKVAKAGEHGLIPSLLNSWGGTRTTEGLRNKLTSPSEKSIDLNN